MQDNGIYRFDKDNLIFKPVSKLTRFMVNHPYIVFMVVFALIVWCALCYLKLEVRMLAEIEAREMEIADLKNTVRIEEEYDTLFIRIAQATLEGKKSIPVSDSIVYAYIKECKAWYPDIIMAQFKMESASGKSDIARNAHNFFGMRPVIGKRKGLTTQRKGEEYKGYAVYDNWHMSVIDKILWDHCRFGGIMPDRKTYLAAHAGYAESEEYIQNIDNVAKKYRQ